jgi:hypothetical protein
MSKTNYTAYQQFKPQDNGTIQAIQHWSGFAEQNAKTIYQKSKEMKQQKSRGKRYQPKR